MKEIWNGNKLDTNFKCWINNKGLWKIEKVLGKSIFCINKKALRDAPTYDDLKNFISGLLEAEKRNDNFIFDGGYKRSQQAKIEYYKLKNT